MPLASIRNPTRHVRASWGGRHQTHSEVCTAPLRGNSKGAVSFAYREKWYTATMEKDVVMRQVILIPDKESGGYVVEVPSLPGCHTQGDTIEEALANAQEAIKLWIEDALEHGEDIPGDDPIIFTSVAV